MFNVASSLFGVSLYETAKALKEEENKVLDIDSYYDQDNGQPVKIVKIKKAVTKFEEEEIK